MIQERASNIPGIKEMTMEVAVMGISVPTYEEAHAISDSLLVSSGCDDLLATAGRTCYQSFKRSTPEADASLVKHMGTIGHYSVLEHCSVTLLVRGGSRAFTHQLVRHRHTGFSQESQRYCDEGNFGYIVPPSIKEAGLEESFVTLMGQYRQNYMEMQVLLKQARDKGKLSSNRKINEDARFLLPNAVASEIIFTPNFAELRHMFKKRLTTHAQWEIFECFRQVLTRIVNYTCAFDDISDHFDAHGNLDTFRDKG